MARKPKDSPRALDPHSAPAADEMVRAERELREDYEARAERASRMRGLRRFERLRSAFQDDPQR